jgi:hypothetical protein
MDVHYVKIKMNKTANKNTLLKACGPGEDGYSFTVPPPCLHIASWRQDLRGTR